MQACKAYEWDALAGVPPASLTRALVSFLGNEDLKRRWQLRLARVSTGHVPLREAASEL
ncbi:MAG: hypothetical protein HY854_18095 [Burkholderiales bacterium]|nr:hypothetical protein [Burkholderiales bacterium]